MSNHSKYPKEAGIYKLTCVNNGKIYIGKTINIRYRMGDHRRTSKKIKGRYCIEHALIKHGWDSFTVEVLEIFENFDKTNDEHNDTLLEMEGRYLKLFDSTNRSVGYNTCKFSTDRTGVLASEETREKLRNRIYSEEYREKRRQSQLGKKLSEETKEKMRNRRHSEETKSKMSVNRLGRKHSEESKRKMSIVRSGKPHSDEHKEKLRQSNFNRGKKLSKETREKMSKARLGRKLSEETKEKLRKPKSEELKENLRKPRSEEIKEKIRQGHLRRKLFLDNS
jgi:group I intron endonuclease